MGKNRPWTGRQSITGNQPRTHNPSVDNFAETTQLKSCFWTVGEFHTNSSTFKSHVQGSKPKPFFEPMTFLMQGKSAVFNYIDFKS